MTTTTRVFSAVAATTLGAGFALMAAGAPATAAPGLGQGQAECGALGGSYDGVSDGWWCTYPAASSSQPYDPALTTACDGEEWATVIDDGIGSIGFRCTYVQ